MLMVSDQQPEAGASEDRSQEAKEEGPYGAGLNGWRADLFRSLGSWAKRRDPGLYRPALLSSFCSARMKRCESVSTELTVLPCMAHGVFIRQALTGPKYRPWAVHGDCFTARLHTT